MDNELYIDPKTKIQELIQAKYKVTPTYEVIEEIGPDHKKRFVVVLKVGEKFSCKGVGTSKQRAEEDAARKAIENMDNGKLLLNKHL